MTKEQTNWEKEFDRQFSYLPPKDNKPPIFMAKGDIKYNLADLQSGSILLPVGATIEKVDNTDVREELKNFISKLISQEREKIVEEIKKGLLNCPKTDWGDTDEETPDSWEEGYEQCLQDTLDFVNNLLQKQ